MNRKIWKKNCMGSFAKTKRGSVVLSQRKCSSHQKGIYIWCKSAPANLQCRSHLNIINECKNDHITWRTCLNCSSNDHVCWLEALPSLEWLLPLDGGAGCGARGGMNECAGKGNATGRVKPPGTAKLGLPPTRPPPPWIERGTSKSSWKFTIYSLTVHITKEHFE